MRKKTTTHQQIDRQTLIHIHSLSLSFSLPPSLFCFDFHCKLESSSNPKWASINKDDSTFCPGGPCHSKLQLPLGSDVWRKVWKNIKCSCLCIYQITGTFTHTHTRTHTHTHTHTQRRQEREIEEDRQTQRQTHRENQTERKRQSCCLLVA